MKQETVPLTPKLEPSQQSQFQSTKIAKSGSMRHNTVAPHNGEAAMYETGFEFAKSVKSPANSEKNPFESLLFGDFQSDEKQRKRIEARQKYNIKNFELDNSKDYFQHLAFHVSLDDLYILEEAKNVNSNNMYSPILLRIIDPEILNLNGQDTEGRPYLYLLQVWSSKGVLVFERKLIQKPVLWNMTGKVLLFKEDDDSQFVFMVKLRSNKHPSLFKIKLPHSQMVDTGKLTSIGFVDGHLLGAVGNTIHYFDTSQLGTNTFIEPSQRTFYRKASQDLNADQVESSTFIHEFVVEASDIKQLEVDPNFQTLAFIEFSGEKVIKKELSQLMIVFERLTDHQLVFMKVNFQTTVLDTQTENNGLPLIQNSMLSPKLQETLMLEFLGDNIKKPFETPRHGKIKKWLVLIDQDSEGVPYSTAVVLFEHGETDFYFNFNRVENEKNILVTDIEFDFNFIYLREDVSPGKITLYRVKTAWKQRLGFTSSIQKQYLDANADKIMDRKWRDVLSKRVANYMKLYASLVQYEAYFLVAHRNIVSVFDISNETWTHDVYDDYVRFMGLFISNPKRSMDLNKKATNYKYFDKYKVAVIVGSNKIHFISIEKTGSLPTRQDKHTITVNGMIRRCQKDELKFHGIYLLIANDPAEKILIEKEENRFNTCLLTCNKQPQFYLSFLTENKLWTLLDQRDPTDLDAAQLLSDKTTFVNYVDLWPSSTSVEKEKVFNQQKKHPTTFRKMIMVLNPKNKKIKTFQLESARILQKPGNHHFFLQPFEGIRKHSDSSPLFDISTQCNQSSRLLAIQKNLNPNSAEAGYTVVVMNDKFLVYDGEMKLKFVIEGYKNGTVRQSAELEVYIICDKVIKRVIKNVEEDTEKISTRFQSPGCYVFNVAFLMQGRIEMYKLSSAVVGTNVELGLSNYSERIVFMKNNSEVLICPYVHRNLINLMGVSHKSDYLIWREHGGFFSAMNKQGKIQTWSLATGNKLYNLPSAFGHSLKDYDVYCADERDDSYHRNNNNFGHKSQSLICTREPLLKLQQSKHIQQYADECEREHKISTDLITKSTIITCPNNQLDIERDEKPRGLYNFYLLEMFGHLDCRASLNSPEFAKDMAKIAIDQLDEEVRVVMEFKFELGEEIKDQQNKSWDCDPIPTSHIYISQNRKKLLEIQNMKTAIIYEVDEDASEDVFDQAGNKSHRRVQWRKKHFIERFPSALQGDATVNFIFSANFNYYFDFDYQNDKLIIRQTETQQMQLEIPTDMVNFQTKNGRKDDSQVKSVGKKICFHQREKEGHFEERLIRIINKDDLDCIFEFDETHQLTLLSYSKIDNNDLLIKGQEKVGTSWAKAKRGQGGAHYILEPSAFSNNQTLARLIRLVQNYKSKITHGAYLKGKTVSNQLGDLYRIDYGQDWQQTKSVFVSELSFTILSWKITERLLNEANFRLANIDIFSQLILCFCIFPKSQTIMHKLCNTMDISASEFASETLQKLFQIANKGLTKRYSIFRPGSKFELPFLFDSNGCTPIDLALGINDRTGNLMKDAKSSPNSFQDNELASIYLANLRDASFLHQGSMIVNSVISCLEQEVPGVGEFLDSRFKQIQCMPGPIQKGLKEECTGELNEIVYGCIDCDPWTSQSKLQEAIYSSENGGNQRYDNYIYDLPKIHEFSTEGSLFIDACNNHKDIEIFSHKSIQIMINKHWKQWEWTVTIYMLKFIPYFLLLLMFMFWSNLILTRSHVELILDLQSEQPESPDLGSNRFRKADIVSCWILICLSSFFMLTEVESFANHKLDYILNYKENLTDLSPLVLIYVNTIRSLQTPGPLPLSFWIIQSLAGILLWVKFIWFLRSQDYFSYLIQSLTEAIKDISAFFIILILACVGFADAFHSLSRSMGDQGFVDNYFQSFRFAWLFVLGQNDQIEGVNIYGDILYFIASIVLLIIMLNVLIAIAGESLGRAEENKIAFAFKAKVELLDELQFHPFVRLSRWLRQRKGKTNLGSLIYVSQISTENGNEMNKQEQ